VRESGLVVRGNKITACVTGEALRTQRSIRKGVAGSSAGFDITPLAFALAAEGTPITLERVLAARSRTTPRAVQSPRV
jgi:hypothetical protein